MDEIEFTEAERNIKVTAVIYDIPFKVAFFYAIRKLFNSKATLTITQTVGGVMDNALQIFSSIYVMREERNFIQNLFGEDSEEESSKENPTVH